jgi:signal transduction histidine kinase
MVVSDTGSGIRAEDLRRIFVPFFTTKIGGSGLGLAIVHRIIEEHGGHVRVDSVQGRGTRMTVVLPAGRAIDDTVRDGYGADAEREAIIPVPGSGYAGGFAERYARGRP